jgi:2-polyprenyl-3-methyl-5-hydroxy-6-metoxy-1,4-benzoquinol methylase
MEADFFTKEVYRRMALRASKSDNIHYRDLKNFLNQGDAKAAEVEYKNLLPKDKNARILDIGFGSGWFIAACVKQGYTNIYGADFFAKEKAKEIVLSCDAIKEVYDIDDNIGNFLSQNAQKFDFIHMSHVIEHVPKYSLFYIVDSLFKSLSKGGILLLRTPNMEGPAAMSSYYVTLTHEYGFCASNLHSLLHISGFDNIIFHQLKSSKNLKQYMGFFLRMPLLYFQKIKHRLFGVNHFGIFNSELVVTASRQDNPELFDEKFK